MPFTPRHFDPADLMPLYRQLYGAVREAILRGQLPPGARLPATRTLAAELGLSRTTVVTAMTQLLAEGYIEGHVGSGTYVTRLLPDVLLHVETSRIPVTGAPAIGEHTSPPTLSTLSRRGSLLAATSTPSAAGSDNITRSAYSAYPFRTGLPALDIFPWRVWKEIEGRLTRHNLPNLSSYGNPAGYGPLRQAIADYLGVARALSIVSLSRSLSPLAHNNHWTSLPGCCWMRVMQFGLKIPAIVAPGVCSLPQGRGSFRCW